MRLAELLAELDVVEAHGPLTVEVQRLCEDSRSVTAGTLFVARRGEHYDGHDFVADAVGCGAVALLVAHLPDAAVRAGVPVVVVRDPHGAAVRLARRLAGEPSQRLHLVGITGTNGKSTTAFLVRALLRARGAGVGLIGTIEYQVGNVVTVASHTTPDALRLQALLGRMVDAGATYGVMEVSSHGLHQGRVEGCRFATLVFTNLSQDHLDYHPDMASYFAAKASLFQPRYTAPGCVAVVNGDDPRGAELAARTPLPILTFGLGPGVDLRATAIDYRADGTRFTLHHAGRQAAVASRLLGEVNVYNALAAAAVGVRLDWTLPEVAAGLATCVPVPGRYERIGSGGPTVVVDYAHTPDALARAVADCRRFTRGRLIVVFGCGGDRDRTKRPLMGQAAAVADRVIVTSDNPRSEEPLAIIRAIEPGLAGCPYTVEPDRRAAIAAALAEAAPEDTVLIAGKGHEDYQLVAGQRLAFDDRKVAEQLILRAAESNGPPPTGRGGGEGLWNEQRDGCTAGQAVGSTPPHPGSLPRGEGLKGLPYGED
ncbi:MAG TPA: UDP-N-acetylmuramoyl-L-alanyl-D-glutamate--2,6-diaminopimelate ligase [bacterium]|jgi:UDP-N-acetylmuramoyl-L-alanyl-D-glutamate--2,6-diaminopimelate ligase